MSRKAQKYFFLLVLLLNGILSIANSGFNSLPNFSFHTNHSSIVDGENNCDVKQALPIYFDDLKDRVEISEVEVEEEENSLTRFNYHFNFFGTYLATTNGLNATFISKNKLMPCKDLNYVSTINSWHILFCVYRI